MRHDPNASIVLLSGHTALLQLKDGSGFWVPIIDLQEVEKGVWQVSSKATIGNKRPAGECSINTSGEIPIYVPPTIVRSVRGK